jgi:hypothetical protein
MTISFYARAGANYSAASSNLGVRLFTGTGTDQPLQSFTGFATAVNSTATLTTSWARYSYTITLGSTVTEFGLNFNFVPVGTAGAADYFDVTGVQIELGSVATTFKRASGGTIQGELAACQRYFEKSYNQATAVGATNNYDSAVLFDNAGGGTRHNVQLKVVKRSAPTITYYNPETGTSGQIRNTTTSGNVTASAAIYIGQGSFNTDGGIIGTSDYGVYQWTASAEL